MNMQFASRTVLTIWLATSCGRFAIGVPPADNTSGVTLDDKIQQGISNVVSVLLTSETTGTIFSDAIDDFLRLDGSPHTNLLLQVLAVYGGKEEHLTNPHVEMAKRLLIARLIEKMSDSEIIYAVAPSFEACMVPITESAMRQVLGMVSLRGDNANFSNPNFQPFVNYIRNCGDKPPEKLVAFIFNLNPENACLAMTRAYGTEADETELRVLMKQPQDQSMPKLGKDARWWVRLYAAEILTSMEFRRKREILEELVTDPQQIVREKAFEVLRQLDSK